MSSSDTDSDSGSTIEERSQSSWQVFLADLVRVRPVLCDKAHKHFNDTRGAKLNAWKDVMTEMQAAGFSTLGGTVPQIGK